ncbi:MAG: helix-turn-helix transcriptional regulator [Oscillospiraceae bacterium]|nr:helix-turn-helix transcriptional regulator [Oscillospiraceae bacterium]
MIVVNLDVVMAMRKIGVGELAEKVDITMANLSILKNNRAKAVRFSTLDALCRELHCQPGDILAWEPDEETNDE